MQFSKQEQEHYSRHLILEHIGPTGQLKLKQAKVLVIGAGGLGCPVLQYLTAAGVGTIGIVDDDLVSTSNLQRQILYRTQDIGQPKVSCAKKALKGLNPHINFNTYEYRLNTENALELFKSYDIIVDGTDNFTTRYLCNDAAIITDKPLVFGSIYKFEGQVSVFNFKNGPTYRCLYPSPPEQNTVPNCSEVGVLGVLPGIIGTLQANEVLKIILGLEQILSGKLLTFNALSMTQHLLAFNKNSELSIKTLGEDYHQFCNTSNSVNELNFTQYTKEPRQYNVLDVRTVEERRQFCIESLHIPLDEISQRFSELPQNKKLLVYCKSGVRSKAAIDILKKQNINCELFSLKDGLKEYHVKSEV